MKEILPISNNVLALQLATLLALPLIQDPQYDLNDAKTISATVRLIANDLLGWLKDGELE